MNSYQGCENVQHCHWDMWTDCIIIQQRVYNLCLFVCSAERYGAHCCLYYIRCSYVLDFELWNMWFMEIIQISTSLEEDLLWWCIMLLHTTRMTFFHLWYSKKTNDNKINGRYFALWGMHEWDLRVTMGILVCSSHRASEDLDFFWVW